MVGKFLKSTALALAFGTIAFGASAQDATLDLVGPLAEYKIYVAEHTAKLVEDTKAFTDAVKAGEIDKAKELYAPTRDSYERIEPIAELFSDLDVSIDARADDYEKAEADEAFTGFHRIEYGLWDQNSTEGLEAYADRLQKDVEDLNGRINELTFPPEIVVGGAAVLMEEVAATKISGEENRYGHTDLWDFQANTGGSEKIYALVRPLIAEAEPEFVAKVDGNFKDIYDVLAKYRTEDGGFVTYDNLTDADRTVLAAKVNTLAEDLSTLRGKLGLG